MNFSLLAKLLVYQPVFVILGITVLSISCTIISLMLQPLPDFSDPQKGFKTRGTHVSNRIMAWRKLIDATKSSGPLTSNPKEFEDQRRYEEQLIKPRKKKKNNVPKQKHKSKKESTENKTKRNSIKEEKDIIKGVMINCTSDAKNDSESLYGKLRNKAIAYEARTFRRPTLENFFCSSPHDGYVQILIASTKTDLFTASGLHELCRITKQLESIAPYNSICEARPFEREPDFDLNRPESSHYVSTLMPTKCCRPWTLANYIALMHHSASCLSISDDDVLIAKRQLVQCAPYFFDKRLQPNCGDQRGIQCDVPAHCARHNAVYNILTFLISTDYTQSNLTQTGLTSIEQLKLYDTMIFLPISTRTNNLDFYRNLEPQIHNLRKQDIHIAAMNLGEVCKDDVFNEDLVSDSRLMILGGIFIIILMWTYTSSFFLTFMTITAIIFSLSLAYFVYTFLYNMHFFPFMNLLAFVVAIGVGADDAFIFHKIWIRIKSENAGTDTVAIMTKTLNLALTSMAVTSLTTSAAFMVSTLSAITAIRCFGIFAGTSVLINYIVMSLWIPSCFVIYDRFLLWLDKKNDAANPEMSTSSRPQDSSNIISLVGRIAPIPGTARIHRPITRMSVASSAAFKFNEPLINIAPVSTPNSIPEPSFAGFVFSIISGLRYFCGEYRQRFFIGPMENVRSCILYIITGPPRSSPLARSAALMHRCLALSIFIALTVLATLSAAVVFYNPRLRLPESHEFQLFRDNHPFEQYDMVYKRKFLFKNEMKDDLEKYKMPLRFVWGILPIDDGNHLDPDSSGSLHLDPEFDMSTRESQQFLYEFCTVLKRQPFYKITTGPALTNCFILKFRSRMEEDKCNVPFTNRSRGPCCGRDEKEFPYDPDIFNRCAVEAMTETYKTPRKFFSPGDMAGPYFNKEMFPHVSAVVVEYESNHSFSLSYTEMHAFVTEVENFFKSQLELAPHIMKRGWFSSDLVFYDLQHSLSKDTIVSIYISMSIALAILFLTTLNILTSFYAIFTIVCSILVILAILVLCGWRLNILESVAVSSAIGLAVDFSLHYTVKYNHFSRTGDLISRRMATRQALDEMMGPTSMAALTTILVGVFMIPSAILAYVRIGVFLVTVMCVSWVYATIQLGIILALAGPQGGFCQFRYGKICENLRRKRRRRLACARNINAQIAVGQSPEKDSFSNGNLADDEANSRFGSHEMKSLAQSVDLGTGDVISSAEEIMQQPITFNECESVAGPSRIKRMRNYETLSGENNLQRRASCTGITQAQVHSHEILTRGVSNGNSRHSSFCGSMRYLKEQSLSTESAITIILPDQEN